MATDCRRVIISTFGPLVAAGKRLRNCRGGCVKRRTGEISLCRSSNPDAQPVKIISLMVFVIDIKFVFCDAVFSAHFLLN
jgi:hypothetical protein